MQRGREVWREGGGRVGKGRAISKVGRGKKLRKRWKGQKKKRDGKIGGNRKEERWKKEEGLEGAAQEGEGERNWEVNKG
jgi:hypothetical protein